jgi:hypothetical protein
MYILSHLCIYLSDTPGYQSKMGMYTMGMMASVSSPLQPFATKCYLGSEMGCAVIGRWFEYEVGNGLSLRNALNTEST